MVAVAIVGQLVLADQRRAATLLAATLSRALAREVQIDRVTDLSPSHVVLSGVHLSASGGWPADVAADRVEASGPLVAAARGEAAPVRVTVTGTRVTMQGTGTSLTAFDDLQKAVRAFLTDGPLVDLTLTGGALRFGADATPLALDLVFRKDRAQAHVELALRGGGAGALVLTAHLVTEGPETRLSMAGQGSPAVLEGWLSPDGRAALAGRRLDLQADARLDSAGSLQGRARLGLGEGVSVQGEARVQGGIAELIQGDAEIDLAVGTAVANLPKGVAGRVVLSEIKGRWQPGRDGKPALTASVTAPRVTLTKALAGAEVVAEDITGLVALDPVPTASGTGNLGASGNLSIARLRAAVLEARPAKARFRAALDPARGLRLMELDSFSAVLDGGRVGGTLAWDAERRRLAGHVTGDAAELGSLVRAMVPGALGDADRIPVAGLDVRLADVDPVSLGSGTVDLTLGRAAWRRPNGEIGAGAVTTAVRFTEGGASATLDAASVGGSLAAMAEPVARITAEARVTHTAARALALRSIRATALDRTGTALLEASVEPSPPESAGRLRLAARVPTLRWLQGVWPGVVREVNGTATLDGVFPDSGLPTFSTFDGRFHVDLPDAVLLGDKVFLRQVAMDLPVRRGAENAGPPDWGKIEAGELIGYGVVAHDVVTPARIWHDRLALNDLTYALYSGSGKGWAEAEWGPGGLSARGNLTGTGVRVEEFISAYGIRGGTMTGLLQYELDALYQKGRLGVSGRFEIPEGGRVSIELLDRLFGYAAADPTGVLRQALENLRTFDYKSATVNVRSVADDIHVDMSLKGRERFMIFPPKVREINVQGMPLSVLAHQFPSY